jgi:SAM-dependent methyltransferase
VRYSWTYREEIAGDTSLDRLLAEAEARPVSGWDFSWLGERMSSSPLPWSFAEIVTSHARHSPDLLDMETGGGEWLAALPHRPPRTVATEAWPPNVDVAGDRLRPLGVTVVCDEAAPDNVGQHPTEKRGRLPFPAESFALISNRHGAFVASEVARVLTPGGTFLTQQMGGNYDDFYDALALSRPPKSARVWDVRLAGEQLTDAGLRRRLPGGHAPDVVRRCRRVRVVSKGDPMGRPRVHDRDASVSPRRAS